MEIDQRSTIKLFREIQILDQNKDLWRKNSILYLVIINRQGWATLCGIFARFEGVVEY